MTVRTNIRTQSAKSSPNNISNVLPRSKSVIALRRYLDLSLSGARKNYVQGRGRKEHPLSPYTFDRPEIEKSIRSILQTPVEVQKTCKAPQWIDQINKNVVKHTGEAPLFTEKFLSAKKNEQEQNKSPTKQFNRPLSGVSTKSAPVMANGDMYYRPPIAHKYLHASSRPESAQSDRLTRTYELRKKHRSHSMSALPSDGTKQELQRKKNVKPKQHNLNKDLLPIPCHTGETPHSFIIGARYNCTHFMDSRSFARLGLYLSRQNPVGSFLKSYKGVDEIAENDSDIYVGKTSVQTGGSSGKMYTPYHSKQGYMYNVHRKPLHDPEAKLPEAQIKKVIKEAWLKGGPRNGPQSYKQAKRNIIQSNEHTLHIKTTTKEYILSEIENAVENDILENDSAKNTVKTPMELMQQKIETEELLNRLHVKTPLPVETPITPDLSKQTIEAVLPPTS